MTVRYTPAISVAWDGRALRYYEHEPRRYDPTLRQLVPLLTEWVRFWIITRPACWAAWGRFFIRAARSAVRTGPRGWVRIGGTIVKRIPRLWSRTVSRSRA